MNRENRNLDRKWISKLKHAEIQPVFIMGDHRTGTTILTKLLQATQCFNTISVYHVLNSNRLLHNYETQTVDEEKNKLSKLFIKKGLQQRGIDTIRITPDTPEEYSFIFEKTGYRPQLNPNNRVDLLTLCKKVAFTGAADRPVLLKNPWDYLNFMYVKEAFPNSRFIFIHRHPIRTANSQLKATRAIFDKRNEYIALVVGWYDKLFHQPIRRYFFKLMFSSLFDLGLRITLKHICKANKYYLSNISKLPTPDYTNICYENLCATPEKIVGGILNWLQLNQRTHVSFGDYIMSRNGPLLPDIKKKHKKICQKTKIYLNEFGYNCHDPLSMPADKECK
ncbi:sulfotransferase [Desulfobacula sp.]|uniref:sulfotransferase n=1 Tax=Desulfobacula sp. TaxID=2593537 RepID=UPI00262A8B42|nr:sulfotransferase [Desulfobacula sp.]